MKINVSCETREELLILAQQQGYRISSTQLVRWHRAGLLPRPQQQPRRGSRGTSSLYPSGTGEQLVVLYSLHERERRLSYLAWQLWLMGYRVAPQTIRKQMQEAIQRLSSWLDWFARFKHDFHENNDSGQALDIIELYAKRPLHIHALRRIRKRIGREHFTTFLCLLIELGTETGSESSRATDKHEHEINLRILALGLGLEKRFVQRKDPLEYYLIQVFFPQMRELFCTLQEVRWEYLLQRVTDFELLSARDDLCKWLMRLENGRRYQDQLPNDYPRWDLNAQEIFRSLPNTGQALVLAGWLALRLRASLQTDPI